MKISGPKTDSWSRYDIMDGHDLNIAKRLCRSRRKGQREIMKLTVYSNLRGLLL